MASSYLMQKEAEYKVQAQQEKNQISGQIQNQIYQAQKNQQRPHQFSDSLPIGCLGSVVVLAIASTVGILGGGTILLLGIGVTLAVAFVAHQMRLSNTNSHNDRQNQQINNLRQQEAAQHRAVDEKYARMLAQETNRFNASVKSARTKYGGHTAAQPIVKWLTTRFEKEIMNADRRPHLKNIEVVFAFRVDANQLATLKKVGNTNQYGNTEIFDFNVNRFHDLPDYEDRVGFSQAMAKLVQFDIMRRFPKDPVAASHAKPVVVITSNDALMELRYQVANPNYRHAVTL